MRTIAVIPAFQNFSSIAATVRALIEDERIAGVVVADDGSSDETSAAAEAAGARVIRSTKNRGKHAALERGFIEAADADIYLMVDGDTGPSASAAIELVGAIERGEADMVVGALPRAGGKGGLGLVRGFAALAIRLDSGFESVAPLSGQRALKREVFEACRPLAKRFGVDAALTSDAVKHGFRVKEVPILMTHDHRGRSFKGFAHRAMQGAHILRAFAPRLVKGRSRRS